MRRVCLAIGVSRAEGLAPLRAAATAAEEIGQWAERSGFAEPADIRVLTDRKTPVTTELIRDTIVQLLPVGVATDTFLLHFAGHGLREDSTRTLWLPTDWRTELRAIAVEMLKNRLSDFGVRNLTIISDACKALANDRDTANLTADGVLGRGTSAGVRPVFDRFDAVHDVESAFMIPGATPAQSRCMFSGALIEGLWGHQGAIDPHYPGMVTPGSLADHLTARVAELCGRYGLDCEPQTLPGRPADHLIYFDRNTVSADAIPTLPPWPEPIRAPAPAPPPPPAADMFDAYPADAEAMPDLLCFEFGSDLSGMKRHRTTRRKERTKRVPAGGSGASSKARRKRIDRDDSDGLSKRQTSWLETRARGEAERTLATGRRAERREATMSALAAETLPDPAQANLLLRGGRVAAVWAEGPVARTGPSRWRADVPPGAARQLVVEYAEGVFVPLVVYHGLVTIAAQETRATDGWMCRSPHGGVEHGAIEVLARFQAGELLPSEVDGVAAQLRAGKHANPVLGAVCAYLYDYAGDLDSIRRTASFYCAHDQPIPFDVALMGELATWPGPGACIAAVPAVGPRRAGARGLPGYVTGATGARRGPVGGLCPWLRQGWDFVEAPTDREAHLVRDLPPVGDHLLPETFTALDATGGAILVDHWRMTRWP